MGIAIARSARAYYLLDYEKTEIKVLKVEDRDRCNQGQEKGEWAC